MLRALFIAVLLAMSAPSAAQTLTGVAQSVDGDSLTLSEQRVRLFGIDTPGVPANLRSQLYRLDVWCGRCGIPSIDSRQQAPDVHHS